MPILALLSAFSIVSSGFRPRYFEPIGVRAFVCKKVTKTRSNIKLGVILSVILHSVPPKAWHINIQTESTDEYEKEGIMIDAVVKNFYLEYSLWHAYYTLAGKNYVMQLWNNFCYLLYYKIVTNIKYIFSILLHNVYSILKKYICIALVSR